MLELWWWRDRLRALSIHQDQAADGIVWVTARPGVSAWTRLFEALDLLVLLAHTNATTWREEVKQLWPKASVRNRLIAEGDGVPRPLGVKFCPGGDLEEIAEPLQKLATGVCDVSCEYLRLRQLLLANLAHDTSSGSQRPQMPVRIMFQDCFCVPRGPVAQFMEQFGPLAASLNHHDLHDHAWGSQLVFHLDVSWALMTTDALRSMRRAVESGAQVVSEDLSVKLRDEEIGCASTVDTHRWACSPQDSTRNQLLPSCFTILHFFLVDSPHSIPSLLSAAQVSGSLCRVLVGDKRTLDSLAPDAMAARRRIAWRWIAYAFLSRHASPVVQRLEFNMRFFI